MPGAGFIIKWIRSFVNFAVAYLQLYICGISFWHAGDLAFGKIRT